MRKRLLSTLLALCMVLALLPGTALAGNKIPLDQDERTATFQHSNYSLLSEKTPPPIPTTGDVWDGGIEKPTKLVERDGIKYYEITKCSQLAYVAQTGDVWLTYDYILGNNLILNDVVLTWDAEGNCTNDAKELNEWVPIGTRTAGFSGKFLGNGYVISGIYISATERDVGFFGGLDRGGNVDGIVIVNSYVSGNWFTGGLAGYAKASDGTISNCSFAGAVKGKTGAILAGSATGGLIGYALGPAMIIKGSTNYATIWGIGQVAGIVGYGHYATIRTSCNYGDIKGNTDVGGIVGVSSDSSLRHPIENCYNLGYITGSENAGGISGNAQYSDVSFCYNAGTVRSSTNCGALIGYSDHFLGERSEISNCYYLKDTALNPFGNVSGSAPGMAESLNDTQMKQQSSFVNWDFGGTWAIAPSKNGGYPYLSGQVSNKVPVTGVSLNKANTTLQIGKTEPLTATVTPSNATDKSVIWSSSNASVATVSNSGVVMAVAAGTATITVATTDGNKAATCTVTVTSTSGTTPSTTTPGTLSLTVTNGGLGKNVTVNIEAGHWLTVQTRRGGSISVTSIQAPNDASGTASVTISASAGSVLQIWETATEMQFSNGIPTTPILNTATRSL